MNLINAKYKLNEEEIEFLVAVVKNELASLDVSRYDIKFIRKMMSKMLEVSTNDGYTFLSWFSSVSCDANGYLVDVKLQQDVRVFLIELSTELSNKDLKYFFSLPNNYSRAIYKLLKVHQHKSYANINLQDLKTRLQIPKALNLYSNFKVKVLNVAQQEIEENTDISFSIEEIKDARKVISLVFKINSDKKVQPKEVVKKVDNIVEKKDLIVKEVKKELQNHTTDEQNDEIKRIVSLFDHERKKLQPNYVRKESSYNMSGEYLLRVHLKETGRTPQMFFDAIRWLFSNNPKASFHRQYIMNIGKLIEHFNTLEHQAMYSKEAVEFNEEAQVWYNIYKKQGLSEDDILAKLREGEYI